MSTGWRVRAVAVAVVAVVIVCVGGAAVVWGRSGHKGRRVAAGATADVDGAVVPWADLPGDEIRPLRPVPTTAPSAIAPACRAEALKATDDGRNGAMGTELMYVTLTNVGDRRCLLSGYPTSLRGVRSDGTTVDLSPTHGGWVDPGPGADIAPGAAGHLVVTTNSHCDPLPAGVEYGALRIGLPGGGDLVVTAVHDTWGAYRFLCGPAVTRFGASLREPSFFPDPVSYVSALRIRLDVPSAPVRAGTTLHFTVTLTNTGTKTVTWDPCPSFGVSVSSIANGRFRLNCSAARPLAAGRSESFAMQLAVAEDAPSGSTRLYWRFPVCSAVRLRPAARTGERLPHGRRAQPR